MVIRVSESRPIGDPKKAFDFSGRNVHAFVRDDAVGKVTVGGTYRGTLRLVEQGELLTPQLTSATRLE